MPTEGKGPIVIPCYLVDGVPYVLEVDANGKLAVRAAELETLLAGGLPAALDGLSLKVKEQSPISGFATSANQATMITALQLIDDLRNALLTVASDRLGVRATELETLLAGGLPAALDAGALKVAEQATVTVQATGGDKIFALESIVEEAVSNNNLPAGASGILGSPVPAGKVWVITAISILCVSNTISRLDVFIDGLAGGLTRFTVKPPVAWWGYSLTENLFLQAGDKVAAYVEGATLGDDLYLNYAGYQMDAP